MLTYVYECTRCAGQFEIEQKITDSPRKRCPSCRGKVFRVISGGGGTILKGPGFYVTDYRSSEYKKSRDAEKQPASGSSENASSKNAPSENASPEKAASEKASPESASSKRRKTASR